VNKYSTIQARNDMMKDRITKHMEIKRIAVFS